MLNFQLLTQAIASNTSAWLDTTPLFHKIMEWLIFGAMPLLSHVDLRKTHHTIRFVN